MIQKLKNFFKRFFPVSFSRFDRGLYGLNTKIDARASEQIKAMHSLKNSLNKHSETMEIAQGEIRSDIIERINQGIAAIAQLQTSLIVEYEEAKLDRNDLKEAIIKTQKEQLVQKSAQTEILEQQFDKLHQSIKQLFEFRENLDEINQKLFALEKEITDAGQVYYHCNHEVHSIEEGGFYTLQSSPEYLNLYQALIKGLDEDSIETINRVLSRHLIVRGRSEEYIDLFSKEEQDTILKQRQYFYSNLVKLTPDVFACGKYLLAAPGMGMGFSETTIFIDHAGFEKLDHPERIRKKNILDLGAFIGDSALILSEFTEEKVYVFEPGYENYQSLEKTIKLNQSSRIIPMHAGIGSKKGTAEIPAYFSMGLKLAPQEEQKQDGMDAVPVISVDDFVAENHIEVGLIKVDIEGYEMEFLKGAERTIREQRPAMLLSMYHSAKDFFGIKPLLESWNLGYHFKVHKEVNEHIHYDTVLIVETD